MKFTKNFTEEALESVDEIHKNEPDSKKQETNTRKVNSTGISCQGTIREPKCYIYQNLGGKSFYGDVQSPLTPSPWALPPFLVPLPFLTKKNTVKC